MLLLPTTVVAESPCARHMHTSSLFYSDSSSPLPPFYIILNTMTESQVKERSGTAPEISGDREPILLDVRAPPTSLSPHLATSWICLVPLSPLHFYYF